MIRPSSFNKSTKIFSVSVFALIASLFFPVSPASADVVITDGQTVIISADPKNNLVNSSNVNASVTLNRLTTANTVNLYDCGNVLEVRNSDVIDLSAASGPSTFGTRLQQYLTTSANATQGFTYNANAGYRAWCVGPTTQNSYFMRPGSIELTLNGSAYSFFIIGPNTVLIASDAAFSSGRNSTPLPVFVVTKRVQIKQTADEYTCVAGSYKYGTSSSLSDVSLTGATYRLKSDGSVVDSKTSDTGSYSWKKRDVSASGLITCDITFKSIGEFDKSDWDMKLFIDGSDVMRASNAAALVKRGKAVTAATNKSAADKKVAYEKAEEARVEIMEERATVLSQIAASFQGGKISQEDFNSSYAAQKKAFSAKLAANMEALRSEIASINAAKNAAYEAAEAQFAADKAAAKKVLSAKLEAAGYGFYNN